LSAPAPTTLVPSCRLISNDSFGYGWRTAAFDQQQLKTGCSCSKRVFPSLPPWALISYMRTFLSQEATARCSDTGENERSEMPSSGGEARGTSLEMSPLVLFAEAAVDALLPKRDIVQTVKETKG